jgi:hypothetical protein
MWNLMLPARPEGYIAAVDHTFGSKCLISRVFIGDLRFKAQIMYAG